MAFDLSLSLAYECQRVRLGHSCRASSRWFMAGNGQSRRGFLKIGFGIYGFLCSCRLPAALIRGPGGAARATGGAGAKRLEVLAPEVAAVIDAAASAIVPADETAGAHELGVVYAIDAKLVADAAKLARYRSGARFLEDEANGNFAALSAHDRLAILKGAAGGLHGQASSLFVSELRRDVLLGFYGMPAAWKAIDYDGPPQFGGFPRPDQCPRSAK